MGFLRPKRGVAGTCASIEASGAWITSVWGQPRAIGEGSFHKSAVLFVGPCKEPSILGPLFFGNSPICSFNDSEVHWGKHSLVRGFWKCRHEFGAHGTGLFRILVGSRWSQEGPGGYLGMLGSILACFQVLGTVEGGPQLSVEGCGEVLHTHECPCKLMHLNPKALRTRTFLSTGPKNILDRAIWLF